MKRKTGFTSWRCNFGSTACQKMKIYSDLNIGTEAVDEDSDGIFLLKRDELDIKQVLKLPPREIYVVLGSNPWI